jgi:hypothetical protein
VVTSQLVPLLGFAKDFGVKSLIEALGSCTISNEMYLTSLALGLDVNNENLFFYLDIAQKYQVSSLKQFCGKYLAENFESLLKQDLLQSLDVETWAHILRVSLRY